MLQKAMWSAVGSSAIIRPAAKSSRTAQVTMMADDDKKKPAAKKKEDPITSEQYAKNVEQLYKDSVQEFSKLSKDVNAKIEPGRELNPKEDEVDKFVDRTLWEYRWASNRSWKEAI